MGAVWAAVVRHPNPPFGRKGGAGYGSDDDRDLHDNADRFARSSEKQPLGQVGCFSYYLVYK